MENNNPAYANISGAFNIDGNTINITADFMSYIKLENVAAFVSVNEKETTGNVGSNGETSFNHVMMKLLDSADGNIISIEPGDYQRLEFSFDMSSTHVEDMNDLEVAFWLQDLSNKNVFNSKFAYEYTNHYYPIQNLVETTTGKGERTFSWDAPEQGTPTGYKVYVDGVMLESNTQETSISYYTNKPTVLVEVIALYGVGKTSVSVVKRFNINDVSIAENEASDEISIYPNPARDFVNISGNDLINSVKVYNCLGMMVEEIEVNANEAEINISDYNTGIYFVDVQTENGNIVKKVVIR